MASRPEIVEVLAEELRATNIELGRIRTKLEETANERMRLVERNPKVKEYVRLHQVEGGFRDEVVRIERRLVEMARRLAEVL